MSILRIASSLMDLSIQSGSLEVMIGVGRRRRARSDLLATLTRTTQLLYKTWHGDIPDDYERVAAGFEIGWDRTTDIDMYNGYRVTNLKVMTTKHHRIVQRIFRRASTTA